MNGIPRLGDQVVEDQQYPAGEAVSLELPEAEGGNVALTYFLDGELPPGLAFNPTARTISGELSPNVSYSPEGYALTYRVADVDGEEPAPLTFTISVNVCPSSRDLLLISGFLKGGDGPVGVACGFGRQRRLDL